MVALAPALSRNLLCTWGASAVGTPNAALTLCGPFVAVPSPSFLGERTPRGLGRDGAEGDDTVNTRVAQSGGNAAVI